MSTTPATTLTLLAPAKLNLALSVGPPTVDEMHPICSWMVTVDLYDELTVTRLESDRFSRYAILWHEQAKRTSEIDWSIKRDLAVRAHLAMESHFGERLPVQLKLEKRIPVGGGLGGGSSDAAAMLHAVNELYGLGLSVDELAEIGSPLGSDVAFLVHGGSAIVEGLGDRITPQPDVPDLNAVIIFPQLGCATGEVYRYYDTLEPRDLRPDDVRSLAEAAPAPPSPEQVFNDLTDAAFKATPALENELVRVQALAERPVHLAGSGSSLFVICDDHMHAEFLAEAIEKQLGLPSVAVKARPRVIADTDPEPRAR